MANYSQCFKLMGHRSRQISNGFLASQKQGSVIAATSVTIASIPVCVGMNVGYGNNLITLHGCNDVRWTLPCKKYCKNFCESPFSNDSTLPLLIGFNPNQPTDHLTHISLCGYENEACCGLGCCDTGPIFRIDVFNEAYHPPPDQLLTTSHSAPNATATHRPGVSEDLSSEAQSTTASDKSLEVGIGVGLGVGLLLVGSLLWLAWEVRRRHPLRKTKTKTGDTSVDHGLQFGVDTNSRASAGHGSQSTVQESLRAREATPNEVHEKPVTGG